MGQMRKVLWMILLGLIALVPGLLYVGESMYTFKHSATLTKHKLDNYLHNYTFMGANGTYIVSKYVYNWVFLMRTS